jgi:hypothetical protein
VPARRPARTTGALAPGQATLSDDVIDPVQSEKSNENQVDSHCEAHDPGRNQQEHSRGQGSDWQKRLGSIEVHPELITDSDASPPAGAGVSSDRSFAVRPIEIPPEIGTLDPARLTNKLRFKVEGLDQTNARRLGRVFVGFLAIDLTARQLLGVMLQPSFN